MSQLTVRCRPQRLALLLSATLAGAAHAQTATEVPEVLVTAQRTASIASKTPIAMSVLSGAQLADADLSSPADIGSRLPDVRLDGNRDGLKITIRGVTNADSTEKGDPSAVFLLDGVYQARPQIQNLSLFDVARVEVLRGPQGTLYGRNATAGAIHVISNAPGDALEGAVSAAAGNYNSRATNAMLNVPLGGGVALRAALAVYRHDSYLRNDQGTPYHLGLDRDDVAARLSVKAPLGANGSLLLRVDHSRSEANDDSFVPDTNFFQGIASGNPAWYAASTNARLTMGFRPFNAPTEQGFSNKNTTGVTAEASWKFDGFSLTWLGGHRSYDHQLHTNYYYRIAPTFALGVREYFDGSYSENSHELRLATTGNGPLSAQAGLYWFRETSHDDYSFRDLELLKLPPYYVFPIGPTEARSKAVFGQATYALSPSLRATAGLRYTDDDKSRIGSTNFQQGPSFNPATDFKLLNAAAMNTHKTTWRLGVEGDLGQDSFAYGSIATGYKAGGFNDGCLAGSTALGIPCPAAIAVPAETLFYQPETLTSYELGWKARFWDKRASLNLAAFHYDYKNLQLSSVAILQGAPRYMTSNAGQATVNGLELDGQLLATQDDRISYGLTWLDAHYTRYTPDGVHSWAGQQLDNAPSNVLTLGYEHRFLIGGGALRAGISTRSSSAYQLGVPTQGLIYHIPARTLSDASLRYQPDGQNWSLALMVKNLEDKVQPLTIDSFGMTVPSDPRSWKLRADIRF